MRFWLLALIGALAPIGALAQGPGPCERSPNQVRMMGTVDPDVSRCQISIMSSQIATQATQLSSTIAELTLLQKDLERANADLAKTKKDWTEYFNSYVGK